MAIIWASNASGFIKTVNTACILKRFQVHTNLCWLPTAHHRSILQMLLLLPVLIIPSHCYVLTVWNKSDWTVGALHWCCCRQQNILLIHPQGQKSNAKKSALHSILCLQPQPVMNKVNKLYLLPGITRHNVFHFSVEENMDCCCWFFLFYTWLWGQASHNIFCIQKYL